MRRRAEGRIHERIKAIGSAGCPVYVVRGDEKRLLIDAGVSVMAPSLLASIEESTREPGPGVDYLFLTHSHYDHLGSAPYLKRHLPGLKIGAHERVAALVRKPSVLEAMIRLSAQHVDSGEVAPADEGAPAAAAGDDPTLQAFDIDLVLRQGDELDLGGVTCRVYETPGHTRDCLTFHLPEIGAVFPGEACGVLRTGPGGRLQAEFMSSYEDYVDSLALIASLRPQILCLAHNYVLTGRDAVSFLDRSAAETVSFRQLIERYLAAAAGDIEEAIEEIERREYRGDRSTLQPGFRTNLTAQVRLIAGSVDRRRA